MGTAYQGAAGLVCRLCWSLAWAALGSTHSTQTAKASRPGAAGCIPPLAQGGLRDCICRWAYHGPCSGPAQPAEESGYPLSGLGLWQVLSHELAEPEIGR